MEIDYQQIASDLGAWLSGPVALYWLIAAVLIAVALGLFALRYIQTAVRQAGNVNTELRMSQAAAEQKIEAIEADNIRLSATVQHDAPRIENLTAEAARLKSMAEEKAEQLGRTRAERDELRDMCRRAEVEVREKTAFLDAERKNLQELKSQFEQQKTELKNEFKVVSAEIMKERQEALSEQNKEGVGALLKPLKEQIKGFEERVNKVHSESIQGNTELKSQIENVMQMGIKMRDEANSLTTALKGDSQQRGAWGEAQLEKTLELSGLVEKDHYDKQTSFRDGEGKRKQTDYIIKLPGEKCIIIDSKVSLIAYEQAVNAEPDERDRHMDAHVQAVRAHIADLSNKDYASLSELHSPDYVLMFMPIEAAFIEALKHDRDLFQFGYQKNVVLVSHTTLIPILRTVANLWTIEQSTREARLLGDRANEIYNSVALVSERLEKMGKSLQTTASHYNGTVTALVGNQGLQGKVARFSELSANVSKTMPKIEETAIDVDMSKLQALPASLEEGEEDDEKE